MEIRDVIQVEPFEFRWPDAVERFDRGWEFVAESNREAFRVRHALAVRIAFGRPRVRSVTWVGGEVAVEGAGADDYEVSRALISVIKGADRTMARRTEAVPPDIQDLPIVVHRDEIDAPWARRGLAVKLAEDDLAAWALYAIGQIRMRGKPRARRPMTNVLATSPPHTTRAVAPTDGAALPLERKRAIAGTLLAYAASGDPSVASASELTMDPAVDQLVRQDPFAFLLGVIFDQGIPYERAWAGPHHLLRRLGHLDPMRIASEPEQVRTAVHAPPKLHRFVENVPAWVVLAAKRVLDQYAGDAGRIWGDQPTARELQRRLMQFVGIGQKKAAMAVEILERDLNVPIREMAGSDIAYDIHVRRVFLRTGFADEDSMEHMVAVARQLHPERPGALDEPAWRVGLNWCHPKAPDCPACALGDVCAKLIDRTIGLQ